MTPEGRGRFVKVYYSVVNDERFADVFHDARVLGTWLQLLLVADAMYPVNAPLPSYVGKSALKVLIGSGLVEIKPHNHYVIHGLAAEREMRAQYGRNAATVRWQSSTNASAMPREESRSIYTESRLEAETARGHGDKRRSSGMSKVSEELATLLRKNDDGGAR